MRLLFALALVLVALFVAPRADAQSLPRGLYPDREAAHAACVSDLEKFKAYMTPRGYNTFTGQMCQTYTVVHRDMGNGLSSEGEYVCNVGASGPGGSGTWTCSDYGGGTNGGPIYYAQMQCPSGATWDAQTNTCSSQCANKPDLWGFRAPDDSGLACKDGCEYLTNFDSAHDPSFGMSPTGQTCTVSDDNSPVDATIDSDGDGVPDVDDKFPNDPKESSDTDGDGIGDNSDTAPDDPDNGKDDGEGNESDNQAGGGGTCAQPPTCSGDAIACASLQQAWLNRCHAGEAVTGSPTVCNASYTCSGDVIQCAQMAVMRKAACAIEALKTIGGSQGDANGNGQPDWTEGAEPGRPDENGDDATTRLGLGLSPDLLDREEIFGGGSCQQFSITIMGKTTTTADIPAWCTILLIMRAAVLLMASFFALQILMGRVI